MGMMEVSWEGRGLEQHQQKVKPQKKEEVCDRAKRCLRQQEEKL
jgi:hypothetical protein